MMSSKPQTRDNHVRLHPPFHLFIAPGIVVLLVCGIVQFVRRPGLFSGEFLLLVIVFGATAFLSRTYALKVQDRVIRLEERLRLARLLPTAMQPSIESFSEAQLIAMRFASDAEIPALADRVLRENLGGKEIKQAIQGWRPDYYRV